MNGLFQLAMRACVVLSLLAVLGGCGLLDSGVVWRDGPVALTWIDIPAEVTLSYDRGDGAWDVLVDQQVFAVGADSRYVVAKQHPAGDASVTSYFVLYRHKGKRGKVVGPMSAIEFSNLSERVRLPAFSHTLASLE